MANVNLQPITAAIGPGGRQGMIAHEFLSLT